MIKAKKSLGQNFLIDKNILNKIVNITDIQNKLILASSEGVIISISPFNGNLLSTIKTNHEFKTHPIMAGKTIYLLSRESNIIALEWAWKIKFL